MESKFVLKRVLYLFIQKFEVFKEVLSVSFEIALY